MVFWERKKEKGDVGVVEKRCERVCVLAGGESRTREAKREREGKPLEKEQRESV